MKSKPHTDKIPLRSSLLRPRAVLNFGAAFMAVFLVASCSTKKDRFVNRNWHALNSKYNVLFNGEMAFDQAWNQLQNGYEENFWEPLPIERFVANERKVSAALVSESPFSLAEEKAVKAIKTHGMSVKGVEKNPQMIAAYSLLGRSRYFDQRFVPALEAFNYIIGRYPASNKLNEVRIWKEKTNLRLGNERVALENIKRLLKHRKLKGETLSHAYAVRAQAYLALKLIDSSAWDLKRALKHSKKPLEKARYAYILGQFYQAQQQPDSALWAYERVIDLNRKIPRIFLIQSKLQRLFLKAKAGNTDKEAVTALSKLEANWENAPFLDRIYFEKSQLLAARGQDSLAISYAQKSLKTSKSDPRRNAENYSLVAEIYFDQAEFKKAGIYYDSLSQQLDPSSLDYLRSQKKIKGLKGLVRFKQQLRVSDSLLVLAALGPEAQRSFVQHTIEQLKKRDSISFSALADTLSLGSLDSQLALDSPQKAASGIERPSSFYFYNEQAVANGALAFQNQWGNRDRVDNWRWILTPMPPKAIQAINKKIPSKIGATEKASGGSPSLPKARSEEEWSALESAYMAGIPKTKIEIDSLNGQSELAHLQLGRLFAADFKRPDLALESLLWLYKKPASPDIMPHAIFELFQLYKNAGSYETEPLRSELLQKYPESDYAQALRDPRAFAEKKSLIESQYDSLYKAYLEQDYSRVMAGTTALLSGLLKDSKGAATALLQANTIGRLYGFAAYKNELKKLIESYPNHEVAIMAQNRLSGFESNPPETSFTPMLERDRIYVALLFSETYNREQDQAYQKAFNLQYPQYKISREVFTPGKTFYVLSGFDNEAAAQDLTKSEFFKQNPLSDQSFFVILGSHYKTLQLFKNLPAYKKWTVDQKKVP